MAGTLVLVGLVYGLFIFPNRHLRKQIDDLERLKVLREVLSEYREERGRFPQELRSLDERLTVGQRQLMGDYVDSWGAQLWYESDGSRFLVIAYGRDGERDSGDHDYWDQREANLVCGEWDADQVLTSEGWYSYCGK